MSGRFAGISRPRRGASDPLAETSQRSHEARSNLQRNPLSIEEPAIGDGAAAGRLNALEGKKADFFNFRHTVLPTSPRVRVTLATSSALCNDGRYVRRATVNRHYFNFDEDTLREIIEGWAIPEVFDVYGSFRLPLAS